MFLPVPQESQGLRAALSFLEINFWEFSFLELCWFQIRPVLRQRQKHAKLFASLSWMCNKRHETALKPAGEGCQRCNEPCGPHVTDSHRMSLLLANKPFDKGFPKRQFYVQREFQDNNPTWCIFGQIRPEFAVKNFFEPKRVLNFALNPTIEREKGSHRFISLIH